MSHRIADWNSREQRTGTDGTASWHHDFRDTCWVFVGGLAKELNEGDVTCVLSQYGEIEDINLVRDTVTGQSKGFAFCKYEDWRSTVLCVDNFNGAKLLGFQLKVNHTRYERPKMKKEQEQELGAEELQALQQPGHAYRDPEKIEVDGPYDISHGVDIFAEQRKLALEGGTTTGFVKRRRVSDALKKQLRGLDSSSSSEDDAPKSKKPKKSSNKKNKKDSSKKKHDKSTKSSKTNKHSSHETRKPSPSPPAPKPAESDADRRRRLAALSSLPAAGWDAAL